MPKMVGATIAFPTSQDVAIVSETVVTLAAGTDQLRVTSQGGITPAIAGIIGGADNQALVVFNVSGAPISVYLNHPFAPAGAAILNSATLANGNGCLMWRDPLSQAWRVLLCGG